MKIAKVLHHPSFRGPRVLIKDTVTRFTWLREEDERWVQRLGDLSIGEKRLVMEPVADRHPAGVELEMNIALVRDVGREGFCPPGRRRAGRFMFV